MKSKNEVTKQVWKMLDHVKSTVSSNLVMGVSRGDLKVDRKDLDMLVKFVSTSIDQAAIGAAKDFEKQIHSYLLPDQTEVEVKSSKKK